MDLGLFSYSTKKTIIHKIPVIIKFIVLCLISVFVFFDKYSVMQIKSWLLVFFLSVLVFCFVVLAKISIRQIKPLLFVPFFCLLLAVIRMITFSSMLNSDDMFFTLGFVSLNLTEGLEGLLYTLRFFTTTIAALVFFSTSTSLEILSSFEAIQKILFFPFPFLKKINLAKMISLTLNFIPMVFETWNKVSIACKARNPKFQNKNQTLIQKVKIIFQLFTTTFSCLLSKAEIKRKAMLNRG